MNVTTKKIPAVRARFLSGASVVRSRASGAVATADMGSLLLEQRPGRSYRCRAFAAWAGHEKDAPAPSSETEASDCRGGDGGNRTHVRNRAKDGVYERSRRSKSSLPLANAGGVAGGQPRKDGPRSAEACLTGGAC